MIFSHKKKMQVSLRFSQFNDLQIQMQRNHQMYGVWILSTTGSLGVNHVVMVDILIILSTGLSKWFSAVLSAIQTNDLNVTLHGKLGLWVFMVRLNSRQQPWNAAKWLESPWNPSESAWTQRENKSLYREINHSVNIIFHAV